MRTVICDLTDARPDETGTACDMAVTREGPAGCHRVALVNASLRGEAGATGHLIADLADALCAYARAYGEGPVPELVPMGCPREGAGDASVLVGCDTLLLAYPPQGDVPPSGLADLLGRARGLVAGGTRAYALAVTRLADPSSADPSLREVEGLCRAASMRWMGEVAVGGSDAVVPLAGSPRMGIARRRTSEAVDRLVIAMLGGIRSDAAHVRQPVPRWALRLLARRDAPDSQP